MTLTIGVLFFGLLLFFIWRKERKQSWKTANDEIKSAIVVEPFPAFRKAAEKYARINGSYPQGWDTYAALHSKWSQ